MRVHARLFGIQEYRIRFVSIEKSPAHFTDYNHSFWEDDRHFFNMNSNLYRNLKDKRRFDVQFPVDRSISNIIGVLTFTVRGLNAGRIGRAGRLCPIAMRWERLKTEISLVKKIRTQLQRANRQCHNHVPQLYS